MKKILNNCHPGFLSILLLTHLSFNSYGQEEVCDQPNYSFSNIVIGSSPTGVVAGEENIFNITVGEPVSTGTTGSTYQGNSIVYGHWSFYNLEPQAPHTQASEGEFLDRIQLDWEIVDDLTAPGVTEAETKIYRNGNLLTTVPLSQTTYQDFNVFPGEFYTYEVVVTNEIGDSRTDPSIGFLTPNGRVTGNVSTRNDVPVADVKVTLTPNLGRTLDFEGVDDYVSFHEETFTFNEVYTIEGWFRNVDVKDQTLFVAVDSGTADVLIKISLDDEGRLSYHHDGDADGTGLTLSSRDAYNLTAAERDWHHFAAVHDTTDVYLYVDGQRVDEGIDNETISAVVQVELGRNGPLSSDGFYSGHMDEVRLWNVGRTREEVRRFDDITLTGEEQHLMAYWKFDEQFGAKVFDFADKETIEDRLHGLVCDDFRSDFHSPVQLGAYTDEGGDYIVKGIFYGSGTTFAASPSKETPIGFSMEFDGADDYISFNNDRLPLKDGYTLEGWFKTPTARDMVLFEATDPNSDELLLQVQINASGQLIYTSGFSGAMNSLTSTESYNDEFWYHYAVVHDGAEMRLYIDGDEIASQSDVVSFDQLTRYVIGRSDPKNANAGALYYEGLLDEIRLWDYARTTNQINGTLTQVLPTDELGIAISEGLTTYWMLGEGGGSIISDLTVNGHAGELVNFQETQVDEHNTIVANWQGDDIPLNVEFFMHEFEPNARNVSLDPSNVAVDRVDFTDISQLTVSGFVKFAGTDCFAADVEIKLNGSSLLPPVHTNEDGKFKVELEPGTTGALLSAEFEDFNFDPGFIELPRMIRPLAGMKFETNTVRKIDGVVAGGECKLPIGDAIVRAITTDGCLEVFVEVDNSTGTFSIADLPPKNYTVSVEHPDPVIQEQFDLQGAYEVSLVEDTAVVDFIYYSETQVEVNILNQEDNDCGLNLLDQNEEYDVLIKLFQTYDGEECLISSGQAYIQDNISPFSPSDTVTVMNGFGNYTVVGGPPNLASPYTKTITIIGEDSNGAQATDFEEVVVLGYKTLSSTFETSSPELPFLILRDPPGDASHAYIESEKTTCNNWSFEVNTNLAVEERFTAHLGPDIEFSSGFGVEKVTEIDVTADLSFGFVSNNSFGAAMEGEVCFTSGERISTSDGELDTGEGADLFVGGAFNILVGTNRTLTLSESCSFELEDVIMLAPKEFATTYIYTSNFIKQRVIPDLEGVGDTESIEMWNSVLEMNEKLKNTADFEENISFSSGTTLERSQTRSQSSSETISLSSSFGAEIGSELGIEVDGLGFTYGANVKLEVGTGGTQGSSEESIKTVGYVLDDEDFGDNFSIDIKTDRAGMPVFDLVGGESLCPHEPGTKARMGVSMTPTSPTVVVDVPENEEASFTFSLGNIAETAEDQFYAIRVLQESNPSGALIKINGVPVEESISLFVRAGRSEEVTVTVERGPEAYVYNDLELEFFAPCELEKAQELGEDIELLINGGSSFFDREKFSVEFVKTCGDLTVFSPGSDWLINESSNNTIAVTVKDFDLEMSEFERVRFQYRPLVEGEPFVNAVTFEKSDLVDNFVTFDWDVSPVADNQYEIRAISECNSGFFPGVSEMILGRIDRQAPTVFGTPEPVGNVLNIEDEISIQFEEDVNCQSIISLGIPVSLEVGSINNVDFANTENGISLAKEVSCEGNKLIIIPDIQNKFIEGNVVRVDLLGIEDLFGNVQSDMVTWEFDVRRNPLEWLGGDVNMIADEGNSAVISRQIVNNGPFAVDFALSGPLTVGDLQTTQLPEWLEATPMVGTIPPGGTETIELIVSDQIGGGQYDGTVVAANTSGALELRVDLRVLCPEPEWSVIPADFENSMTITAELIIAGDVSDDEFDLVAVLVGDEVRGVGRPEYVAELDRYEVFLTVYSNQVTNEEVTFSVWDASQCKLFAQTIESYTFGANAVLGAPSNPVTITTTANLIQELNLSQGWTWVSFNLDLANLPINETLSTLQPTEGDIIKSQTAFAQYTNTLGWVGTLSTLDNTSMYQINLGNADELEYAGLAVDIETTFIDVQSGWTWISYLPQSGLDVNTALSSLSPITGDLIKNQTDFAQYVENKGWIGSLDFLRPNDGYLINITNGGTLEYPLVNSDRFHDDSIEIPEELDPRAAQFEHSMTLTVVLSETDFDIEPDSDAVLVMKNDKIYGYGTARDVGWLEKPLFFVTMYSNRGKEEGYEFKYYQASSDRFLDIQENVNFVANTQMGQPLDPLELHVVDQASSFNELANGEFKLGPAYPNPFNEKTLIEYSLVEEGHVRIAVYGILGQQVTELISVNQTTGKHIVEWNGKDSNGHKVSSGIYVVRMITGQHEQSVRLIVKP